jgi:hypothetical protein
MISDPAIMSKNFSPRIASALTLPSFLSRYDSTASAVSAASSSSLRSLSNPLIRPGILET